MEYVVMYKHHHAAETFSHILIWKFLGSSEEKKEEMLPSRSNLRWYDRTMTKL